MEFLLILSALLSAATGALTGARAPEAAPRHEAAAQTAAIAQSSIAVVAPAAAGAAARPFVDRRSRADAGRAFAPALSIPLYADRLIE